MKLFTFQTNDRLERIGTFWSKDEVIDIIAIAELLSKNQLKNIRNMKSLIENENSVKIIKSMLDDLKKIENEDSINFSEYFEMSIFDLKDISFKAPLNNPQKIICLGRNFAEHAKEGGKEPPKNPMIWGKFNSAIIGHQDYIIIPKISNKVDVEIELVIVIGKEGKHISENKALEFAFGYTIGNDVTARDYQYTDQQFTRAKTMDTFAPLGPWIITSEELKNPQNLEMELKVNGKTWQKSNTNQMIFSVAYIISYLSKSFTFKPGDLIFTGTPSGVGHYQNPPVYLKSGDIVSLTIDKIGKLENPVKNEE